MLDWEHTPVTITVDLQHDVISISKTASHLAILIRRGTERGTPILITQKGAITAVLLSIDAYTVLRTQVEGRTALAQ